MKIIFINNINCYILNKKYNPFTYTGSFKSYKTSSFNNEHYQKGNCYQCLIRIFVYDHLYTNK